MALKLEEIFAATNVADLLDEKDLTEIGGEVVEKYEVDLQSHGEKLDKIQRVVDLAMMMTNKKKDFPFENSSNVQYPIIAQAAYEFNARVFPALTSDGEFVKPKVRGSDNGAGARMAGYLNWELEQLIPDYRDGLDKITTLLPVVGTVFRKVYFNVEKQRPDVYYLLPTQLIVNANARNLTDYVKTEVLYLDKRKFKNKVRVGLYKDVDVDTVTNPDDGRIRAEDVGPTNATEDEARESVFLEQHTWRDLDDDGYAEPYIVLVHKDSKQVVRIAPNFELSDVRKVNGVIMYIEPMQYYVKYGCLPRCDGTYYDIGYGELLLHLNELINTNLNQMLDANTLANLSGGFISKGMRSKMGSARFKPGEYKSIETDGLSIRESIFPLTFPGANQVSYQLLEFIIASAKDVAQIKDVLGGQVLSGQKAGTTFAAIQEAMKGSIAIFNRLYESLRKEFELLLRCNLKHPDNLAYSLVNQGQFDMIQDFSLGAYTINPVADVTALSSVVKSAEMQFLAELENNPYIDHYSRTQRMLELSSISGITSMLLPPNVVQQQQVQQEQQANRQLDQALMIEAEKAQAEIVDKYASAEKKEAETVKIVKETYEQRADSKMAS